MGRVAAIVPEILWVLEPDLKARMGDYEAQPEPWEPTLRSNPDGKVNVHALTLALRLKLTQEQHFFKSPELQHVVNPLSGGKTYQTRSRLARRSVSSPSKHRQSSVGFDLPKTRGSTVAAQPRARASSHRARRSSVVNTPVLGVPV